MAALTLRTNSFGLAFDSRLPVWFPMEAIEFDARQFKFGSNARGHCSLAGP
jgi:hypothetical protein